MKKSTPGKTLKHILSAAKTQLLSLSEKDTATRTHPTKWSKKEILGHLIDSAANNHQRFVRGQSKEDMIFEGYDQAGWVKIQNYQSRNWEELVELWLTYNLHLVHVMECMPKEIRFRAVAKHNLHKIAFKTVPEHTETCLEYFMVDYVGHVEHHVRQLLTEYVAFLPSYQNDFHILPI